jgi:hypothetical protein
MTEYKDVRALINSGITPERVTLLRKDGTSLDRVVPNHFGVLYLPPKKPFLYLEVDDQFGEQPKVDMATLAGFDVVKHYYGQYPDLVISFTYLNPKTQKLEPKPRLVHPLAIYYGVHWNHGDEQPDYYVVGNDLQDDKNSEGHFPFWRIGVYGRITRQEEARPL